MVELKAVHHLQQGPAVVQLNVGGTLFQTSKDTLLKEEAAGLRELMVSADSGTLRFDCAGHLFLDSNPRTFEAVLDYLRDGTVALPSTPFELNKLLIDARKFRVAGLEALVQRALPKPAAALGAAAVARAYSANDLQLAHTLLGGLPGGLAPSAFVGAPTSMPMAGPVILPPTSMPLCGPPQRLPPSALAALSAAASAAKQAAGGSGGVCTPGSGTAAAVTPRSGAGATAPEGSLRLAKAKSAPVPGTEGAAEQESCLSKNSASTFQKQQQRRRQQKQGAALAMAEGLSSKRKRPVFEYAKGEWEVDELFKLPVPLPDGTVQWPLVSPGNPQAEEPGSVKCRLCMHFGSLSQFTREEGYTGGRRQALLQHQTRNHEHKVNLQRLLQPEAEAGAGLAAAETPQKPAGQGAAEAAPAQPPQKVAKQEPQQRLAELAQQTQPQAQQPPALPTVLATPQHVRRTTAPASLQATPGGGTPAAARAQLTLQQCHPSALSTPLALPAQLPRPLSLPLLHSSPLGPLTAGSAGCLAPGRILAAALAAQQAQQQAAAAAGTVIGTPVSAAQSAFPHTAVTEQQQQQQVGTAAGAAVVGPAAAAAATAGDASSVAAARAFSGPVARQLFAGPGVGEDPLSPVSAAAAALGVAVAHAGSLLADAESPPVTEDFVGSLLANEGEAHGGSGSAAAAAAATPCEPSPSLSPTQPTPQPKQPQPGLGREGSPGEEGVSGQALLTPTLSSLHLSTSGSGESHAVGLLGEVLPSSNQSQQAQHAAKQPAAAAAAMQLPPPASAQHRGLQELALPLGGSGDMLASLGEHSSGLLDRLQSPTASLFASLLDGASPPPAHLLPHTAPMDAAAAGAASTGQPQEQLPLPLPVPLPPTSATASMVHPPLPDLGPELMVDMELPPSCSAQGNPLTAPLPLSAPSSTLGMHPLPLAVVGTTAPPLVPALSLPASGGGAGPLHMGVMAAEALPDVGPPPAPCGGREGAGRSTQHDSTLLSLIQQSSIGASLPLLADMQDVMMGDSVPLGGGSSGGGGSGIL